MTPTALSAENPLASKVAEHGAEIRNLHERMGKNEEATVRVDGKLDSLKTMILTGLGILSLALASNLLTMLMVANGVKKG
jgi:hypothetical protein